MHTLLTTAVVVSKIHVMFSKPKFKDLAFFDFCFKKLVTASAVLQQDEIWHMIMGHVGRHEWLFLGGVSKNWAALHAGQPLRRRKRRPATASASRQSLTSYSAAAASLRRAVWAYKAEAKKSVKQLTVLQLAKAAASQGISDVLAWARAEAADLWPAWGKDLCIAAISGNQLATVRSLHDDPEMQFDTLCLARAAAGSKTADLAMLQWICTQRVGWVSDELIALRAAAGAIAAIDKLDWLRTFVPGEHWYQHDVWCAMIDAGAVASLQWITAHNKRFHMVHFADRAMWARQFAALRFLVQHGCPWSADKARHLAAAAGDVQMLQWMRDADHVPWTVAMYTALLVTAGQFATVPTSTAAWLREQGAEWPTSFLQPAALPCIVKHMQPALMCWSQSAIQWALANRCPWGAWDSSACIATCSHVYTLRTSGVQQRITWAHAAGCPCSCRAHHIAARLQHGSSPAVPESTVYKLWHADLFTVYRGTSRQCLLAVAGGCKAFCLLVCLVHYALLAAEAVDYRCTGQTLF
jgi:hypothetical protein